MVNTAKNQRKKPIIVTLGVVCLMMVFSYVATAVFIVQNNHRLSKLETEVAEYEKEHNELKIELSRASALDRVLERSGELAYTEVESVSYIQKHTDSSVASR